jgi:hypothetical protein
MRRTKNIFIISVFVLILSACSLKPALELTEEEKGYLEEAYLVTQVTIKSFEEYSNTASDYEIDKNDVNSEKMFAHMLIFSMIKQASGEIDEVPERFDTANNNLTKGLDIMNKSIIALPFAMNSDEDGKIEKELGELSEGADYIIKANKELTSIFEQADMEKKKEKIKIEAEEIVSNSMDAVEK